ncbi:MAG: GNAT family N-acetyltransferase [Candidatus Kapabacteria bacterium]|jgi:RimJ/RimL family protein N-acetyltransferase|nr:GNAT family N-acetyltransferase [Candidatus Kapabacteria bacterium]
MRQLFQTSRLNLRALTLEDAPRLAALDADTDVLRYIGMPIATSPEGYEEFIAVLYPKYFDNKDSSPLYGFWAAEELERGAFLGWFLLRPAPDYRFANEAGYKAGEVEIGYRFHHAAWGKGYATEGARELVRRALLEERTKAIVSLALTENRASTRVMEKCGLVFDREVVLPGYEMHGAVYVLPAK